MRNARFALTIDEKNGSITSISHPKDRENMNWCSTLCGWGRIHLKKRLFMGGMYPSVHEFQCEKVTQRESSMEAVYTHPSVTVTVSRFFRENGNLVERYHLFNHTDAPLYINRDTFGIDLPFNDNYTYADECLARRCHTHIWCGHNTAWVKALRMGPSDYNLGLVLTKGDLDSYSQHDVCTNQRGYFELEPGSHILQSGESFDLEWELFWFDEKTDFFDAITAIRKPILLEARHFTVFRGESIELAIRNAAAMPVVTCNGKPLAVTKTETDYRVTYLPEVNGEHRIWARCGNESTYADCMVKRPFAELMENRLRFLVEKQQCNDENSPLYGAFLIYDNTLESPYFDDLNGDHNASRERLNMALLLARYLRHKNNTVFRAALDRFVRFVYQEIYEETTGEVFNSIGKKADFIRLYNAPGIMLLFAEMYHLTGEDKYLDDILKLAEKYYGIGGNKCYSNAVAIRNVMSAFRKSGRKADGEKMLSYFKLHVDTMLRNGTSYPKHEVNYEQTIVTPAVNCICEMGLVSGEKGKYLAEVQKHLACLKRFSGTQPSYHLREIAIRYWDEYWFGKRAQFGDTLPHHLSCLTARAYISYYRLSGDKTYLDRGEECIRNCLCLIGDDARGHAACIYPHNTNERMGEFFDEWANDQDLPLYDALLGCDLIEAFAI